VHRLIQKYEELESTDLTQSLSLTLEPPATGKIRFVEKGSEKPMAGQQFHAYPYKNLSGHPNPLVIQEGFVTGRANRESLFADEDGVVTFPLFMGLDYRLQSFSGIIPIFEFSGYKPGEVLDHGTMYIEVSKE
jgi:hypothetical protein